jgi:carotenoid cleavage dioxygenase-like enzyme
MTSCHDWKTNRSHFMVWDAKTMDVVTKADLKERVPNGMHSYFVHESDQPSQ